VANVECVNAPKGKELFIGKPGQLFTIDRGLTVFLTEFRMNLGELHSVQENIGWLEGWEFKSLECTATMQ